MMKFFKNLTGQLILSVIVMTLTIFFFSINSFADIEEISVIETDTAGVIHKIPFVLFSIQSESLRQANLISLFHNHFISYDAFSAQIEETEKREDEQYVKIKALQKQSKDMIFLNKEEEEFNERFGHVIDATNIMHVDIKERTKAMIEAHFAQDEMREQQIQNEIVRMETKLADELFLLNNTIGALLDQRNHYIKDIIANTLRNSFFFISFLFVVIVGMNTYVIIQIIFSLRIILKGIEINKRGNLTHRVALYTDNEFGTIAKSFNEAASVIEEKETALKQTMEEIKKQTLELTEKNDYLERFRKVTVGRELKMIELKKEIEDLKKKND